MKKTIFLIVASKILIISAYAQTMQANWSVAGGGSGNELVKEICLTNANELLVAGTFSGSMDLEGTTYNSVAGGSDIFIIKYNSSNTISWVKTFGNACNEQLAGITSDAAGNIYLTGSFYNSLSIDNTTVMSAGSEDLFITSLNADGNLNWLQSYGSTGTDAGTAIKASPDGTVILAATLTNNTFPVADQVSTGISANVAKLTAAGILLWSNCESGDATGNISIDDIAIDPSGTVFVTGSFFGNVDAGDNGAISLQSNVNTLWVGSYTSEGSANYVSVPVMNASNMNGGRAIALNNDSHPIVAGYTTGAITIGSNSYLSADCDVMLFELDATGSPLWSSVIIAPGYQQPNKIALNDFGSVGITGLYVDNFNNGSVNLSNMGGSDGFFMLYENGSIAGLETLQSIGNDNALTIVVREEEFIVAGNYSGNSASVINLGNLLYQSNGGNDFFMVSFTKNLSTGLSYQENKIKVQAYPNPASSYINFSGNFSSEKASIFVYSVEGRLVLSTIADPGFSSEITLNTSGLNPGNYIAVIDDSGNKSSVSFMIR